MIDLPHMSELTRQNALDYMIQNSTSPIQNNSRSLSPADIIRIYQQKNLTMQHPQPNNPLHGVTLEKILLYLVEQHGWEEMGQQINIRCFKHDPSIKSSLTFLRKTPWAREQVEKMYLESIKKG
jgi:hypothetical protein